MIFMSIKVASRPPLLSLDELCGLFGTLLLMNLLRTGRLIIRST